jgi:pyridoxamine 5'-phosphate oxidase-like protein
MLASAQVGIDPVLDRRGLPVARWAGDVGRVRAGCAGLAATARHRLDATRIALLGTVRADGSPRISAVEAYFAAGQLLFGAMGWSRKVADLVRDPRVVMHSVLTAPDSGDPEVKVYGHAVEADPATRAACRDGWWATSAASPVRVFTVQTTEASLIEWNLADGELVVTSWSAPTGVRVRHRVYP